MTGNLPREAITFGTDDLVYASLRVVRAAEMGRSGRSQVAGARSRGSPTSRRVHIFSELVHWGFHLTTMQSHHGPWERPKQWSFQWGASGHEEESWERSLLFVSDFSAPQNGGERRMATKQKHTGQPLAMAQSALITCIRWGVMR